MKKIFIFLLIFISFSELFGQSPLLNLRKYIYLRERLRSDFMIIDSTNRQGTNIPAGSRNRWTSWLSYTENPMIECISPYMILLATEYASNKKFGLDYSQTLNELSYLLLAVERIDLNAEKFFRAEKAGLDPQDSNFWTKVDIYKKPEDLNGFFLRNDIDADVNNKKDTNRIYYKDSTRYIYEYNNEQLKFVNYYDREISSSRSVFNATNGIQTNNRTVMSQDEIWWLYLGLAMTAKLVDSPKKFKDTQGEMVTIGEWIAKITHRTQLALTRKNNSNIILPISKWRIVNPVTSEPIKEINGGFTYYESAGFVASATNIISMTNSTSASEFINDIIAFEDVPGFNINKKVFKASLFSNFITFNIESSSSGYILGLLSEVNDHNYYVNLVKESTAITKSINYEYYPLFWSILNEKNLENNWENIFMPFKNYKDSLKMLLDVMKDCGSFSDSVHCKKSDAYWYKNRMRTPNQFFNKGFNNAVPEGMSINSSMDYMILFNLYNLLFTDNLDLSSFDVNKMYVINSTLKERLYSNPINYKGVDFYLNKNINFEAEIPVNALKKLSLTNEYQIKLGDQIIAYTSAPSCNFNFTGKPCPRPQKSFSKKMNTQSKNRELENNLLNQDSSFIYSVYLNPVSLELTLNINSKIEVNQISLYDFSGRLVNRYFYLDNILYIDFSPMQSGIYLLLIQTEKGVFTEKIIKK